MMARLQRVTATSCGSLHGRYMSLDPTWSQDDSREELSRTQDTFIGLAATLNPSKDKYNMSGSLKTDHPSHNRHRRDFVDEKSLVLAKPSPSEEPVQSR